MMRRCPHYPACLVATTIDERRYCPQHGAPLMPMEQACPHCGDTMLPEDRFCSGCGAAAESTAVRVLAPPSPAAPADRDASSGCGAAQAADAATTTAAPRSDPPSEETCIIYDWLFRQPNGARARLADLIVERRAREPEEIRAALRAFVWTSPFERECRALLLDVALDRVDWDHLVTEYLDRERVAAAEDRGE